MSDESAPAGEAAPTGGRRHARRAALYAWTVVAIVLVVLILALALDNTRETRVGWVVGSTSASVVWVVLAAALFGWLLGIATSVVLRRRTRP